MRSAILILILAWGFVGAIGDHAEGQSVGDVQSRLQEITLRSHIRFLSDDLLGGRGPGSGGDELAQLYLDTQFQS